MIFALIWFHTCKAYSAQQFWTTQEKQIFMRQKTEKTAMGLSLIGFCWMCVEKLMYDKLELAYKSIQIQLVDTAFDL